MIKEIVIAAMLGLILIYEFYVLVNINNFVELCYKPIETKTKKEKSLIVLIAVFNFAYFIFIVAGMAIGTQWYMYGILFVLSIIGSPVIKHFKKKDNFTAIALIRIVDITVSLVIVTKIFFNHFH